MKRICAIIFILYVFTSCGTKRQMPPLDADAEFERAQYYYENKKYSDAISAFERVLFYHPSSAYVDDAQYWLAMAYFEQKDYSQAITEFDYLIRNFPTSSFLEQAYLNRTKAHFYSAPNYTKDATELEQTLRLLDQFLTRFPNSQHTNEVRELILDVRNRLAKKELENAKLYIRIGEEDAALLYFDYVLTTYPETDVAAEAKYLAATVYEKKQQYEPALELYRALLEDENWKQKAEKGIENIEKKQTLEHTGDIGNGEEETNE